MNPQEACPLPVPLLHKCVEEREKTRVVVLAESRPWRWADVPETGFLLCAAYLTVTIKP